VKGNGALVLIEDGVRRPGISVARLADRTRIAEKSAVQPDRITVGGEMTVCHAVVSHPANRRPVGVPDEDIRPRTGIQDLSRLVSVNYILPDRLAWRPVYEKKLRLDIYVGQESKKL
jgi:hypothetical protein